MLAQAVSRVLRERNLNFEQAHIRTGVSASTIRRMSLGLNVRPDNVLQFAEKMGVQDIGVWERLAIGKLPDEQPKKTDPLLSVADDIDVSAIESALNDVTDVSADIQRFRLEDVPGSRLIGGPLRGMQVRGGCMEPLLYDGDIILVAPPESVTSGDPVIATVDFVNVTCKIICIPEDGGPSYLEPINGEGKITEDRFVISGVVVRVLDDVRSRLARRQKGK